MEYIVDGNEAKLIDNYAINDILIPSVALMERAALSCTEEIIPNIDKNSNILVVCGVGNNGADGLAIARMLHTRKYCADYMVVADENNATEEFILQRSINDKLNIRRVNKSDFSEYDVIVDAVFGIGLKRDITGYVKDIIDKINISGCRVYAVDIPSGVNAGNGQIMNVAVRADKTITFGYNKTGLILYPGKEYAGCVCVKDIGYPLEILDKIHLSKFTYTKDDLRLIPKRIQDSNKGTYGRVLIVAGTKNMAGAAYLSAKSAYRMGAGLVSILTEECNRQIVQSLIPEAVLHTYESDDNIESICAEAASRADVIVLGPGMGLNPTSEEIVRHILSLEDKKIIIDADALNIISKMEHFPISSTLRYIITPHIKEMSRLTNISVDIIKKDIVNTACEFANNNNLICVLKDSKTIVADNKGMSYINTSGNSGMSTGGSGDVLTGIIASLVAMKMDLHSAAAMGVYVHGLCGDVAALEKGEYGMMAGDIVESIPHIVR